MQIQRFLRVERILTENQNAPLRCRHVSISEIA